MDNSIPDLFRKLNQILIYRMVCFLKKSYAHTANTQNINH